MLANCRSTLRGWEQRIRRGVLVLSIVVSACGGKVIYLLEDDGSVTTTDDSGDVRGGSGGGPTVHGTTSSGTTEQPTTQGTSDEPVETTSGTTGDPTTGGTTTGGIDVGDPVGVPRWGDDVCDWQEIDLCQHDPYANCYGDCPALVSSQTFPSNLPAIELVGLSNGELGLRTGLTESSLSDAGQGAVIRLDRNGAQIRVASQPGFRESGRLIADGGDLALLYEGGNSPMFGFGHFSNQDYIIQYEFSFLARDLVRLGAGEYFIAGHARKDGFLAGQRVDEGSFVARIDDQLVITDLAQGEDEPFGMGGARYVQAGEAVVWILTETRAEASDVVSVALRDASATQAPSVIDYQFIEPPSSDSDQWGRTFFAVEGQDGRPLLITCEWAQVESDQCLMSLHQFGSNGHVDVGTRQLLGAVPFRIQSVYGPVIDDKLLVFGRISDTWPEAVDEKCGKPAVGHVDLSTGELVWAYASSWMLRQSFSRAPVTYDSEGRIVLAVSEEVFEGCGDRPADIEVDNFDIVLLWLDPSNTPAPGR